MKALLPLLLITSPVHAQLLGGIETFTQEDNANSWGFYNYATNGAIPAPWPLSGIVDPEIYAIFTQDFGVSLFADSISSNGFFIGDYTSAGIDTILCDIYIEDVASFADVEIYLIAGDTFYYSDYFEVVESGWSSLLNSFSHDQWYIFDEGDEEIEGDEKYVLVELTPAALSNVTEIGINFYPVSRVVDEDGNVIFPADGKAVALDNFSLLPDLTPPVVDVTTNDSNAVVSFTGIEGMQYTIESSQFTDLCLDPETRETGYCWAQVGSPFAFEITGPTRKNIPLSAKSFFRVVSQPFFIEIP